MSPGQDQPGPVFWSSVACVIYAASMVLRYVLTMTYRPEMRWFGGTLPIPFHFVLAGFLYPGKFQLQRAAFKIERRMTVSPIKDAEKKRLAQNRR